MADRSSRLYTDSSNDFGCFVLNDQPTIFDYPQTLTNNQGEYSALILGLREAIANEIYNLEIFSDSQLIINQLLGSYKVRDKNLLLLYNQAKFLLKCFDTFTLTWIPREENPAGLLLEV